MKQKKKGIYFLASAIILAFISFYFHIEKKTEESFTYFPPDPTVRYNSGYTTLILGNKTEAGPYELTWRSQSSLDRKAIYRQDVSFLYGGGRLKGKMGEWKQNTSDILQESTLFFKDSQLIQAVSFHFAEIHRDEKISSGQKMSSDFLYIIDSKFSPFHSFRHPETIDEEKWKNTLDQVVTSSLQKKWDAALQKYGINKSGYDAYTLIEIAKFSDKPIPGLTSIETKKLLGQLWEGLFKNYYLGIRKLDGTIEDPIDSILPLILIAKDRSHLLVITETKSGESVLLRQM